MTLSQLLVIMPLARTRAAVYVDFINKAMLQYGIDTVARQAAFLAQLAHESGELRYVRELASGAAYEGREDLGNTTTGDGVRFKGRGLIQITGRANYAALSKTLGVDLIARPELLETPDLACLSAGWFWQTNNINKWVDAGDFDGVCDAVNRGHKTVKYGDSNGFAARLAYHKFALRALTV